MISEGQVGSLIHNSPPERKSQGPCHINVILANMSDWLICMISNFKDPAI